MALLYIDPFAGVAGDMLLAALLGAGLDEGRLRAALTSLPITGYEISVRREKRMALAATRFEVRDASGGDPVHRHLPDIEAIIADADLPGRAAERAVAVFRRLAEAEAKVHGTRPERVHFHEVGAVDSIVDIVGTCAGLAILGVDRVVCGPVPLGSGTVETAHGPLPLPAPATVELLRGAATRPGEESGELTTPTGAALVSTLAEAFGPPPPMTIEAVGYGAGSRQGERLPNVVRVLLGRAAAGGKGDADAVWLLEANLDDASGETLGAAAESLFKAGALDVWMTPATMKKGRPGVVLSCLVPPARLEAVELTYFTHAMTFGVRRTLLERSTLRREHVRVRTPYGEVRVKVGRRGDRTVAARPEYEDCRRLAREAGVPPATVFEAALAAREADETPAEGGPTEAE